jgi:hypothetical protein
MALTVEEIRTAPNPKVLVELLSAELLRLLPPELQQDRDLYHRTLASLPQGLRAMAGIYGFNVCIAKETLASYFCNQGDERDINEALNGLRELELDEIAGYLEETKKFFEPHMAALRACDFGGKEFSVWLQEIGALALINPMDIKIDLHLKKSGRFGLLNSWTAYARKYPERCVVAAEG